MARRVDLDKLSEEFGINRNDLRGLESGESGESGEEAIEDETFPDSEKVDINEPDKILERNITKANAILDKVMLEMKGGNFSARMAEVASLLVNSVTTAVDKVYAKKAGIDNLLVKQKMLDLKEKERVFKESVLSAKKGKPTKGLIITDRESIMKALNEEEPDDNG